MRDVPGLGVGGLAESEQDQVRDGPGGVPETVQHGHHLVDVPDVDGVVDHDVAVPDPVLEQLAIPTVAVHPVERVGPVEPRHQVRLAPPRRRGAVQQTPGAALDPGPHA